GSVVDENVEAAEGVDRATHQFLAELLILDVAGKQQRRAAGLLDPARGLSRVLLLIEIGNRNVGALAGEGDGDSAADTGVAAGDERCATLEPARAAIGPFAVVGNRVHQGSLSRHVLVLRVEWRGGIFGAG